jgi:hypothetical protein
VQNDRIGASSMVGLQLVIIAHIGGSARGYFGPLFTSSGIYLWASTARW